MMDQEEEEEEEEVEAIQLTRQEVEQMLGKSPMHTELKNQLDKVCFVETRNEWMSLKQPISPHRFCVNDFTIAVAG